MSGPPKNWRVDFSWQAQWIPQMCAIIGPYLLMPSTLQQDREHATDLIVLLARDMRIACRLRRWEGNYWRNYPGQFTIRCHRDSGAVTELAKITDGFGDWMFYGHAGPHGISPWMLIDLHMLRRCLHGPYLWRCLDGVTFGQRTNGDGTGFMFFTRHLMPPELTIAHSG